MAVVVKFVSGEERQYDGETAALQGPVLVLYKRKRRKLESSDAFPAETVVWAQTPDGRTILGRGTIKRN